MEFSNHSKGVTSVKVHHTPGGGSSIQLGGGYGDDDNKNQKNVEVKKATEEQKEEEEKDEQGNPKPAAGQVQKHHEGTKENPAIKARAPPGGASSISFG
eukprot:CAMPEP_0176371582 /NCGR_PEP_ID=MMETSP0126-20121128/24796_1 /TAXON_ID=141414 ORGANISM="Strombidinopsis acuminatum, Strain SPMC142" /NCGR_SAMPLE_ID=MMETSP0126 /ASSEMBLY_ACC=CAM_ASM_000229 /LENGTH=98 /DNA_ID=CAMNT_0017731091 /DNA_START=32 /DNA_END=328 /DNA_ORIENTATION=-